MKEYTIPVRSLFLWQIRSVIMALVFYFVLCVFSFDFIPVLVVTGVFYSVFIFVYLPLFFKSCKIKYFNGSMLVKKGVILKRTYILPFPRLIFTQTYISPLARILDLCAVSLKAARSRIFVPEINMEDAKAIISNINQINTFDTKEEDMRKSDYEKGI